ncbi:hypothetical protein SAMN05216383_13110 [Prevotella sp. KH2C16]|nr:hypothetical protein SAMN05216383_11632 [Prevotella sp. KH2C16]SFG70761.1 hypothetical protein SAMN05216383_13110 [Prevotella sp. KH2C16]
MTDTLLFDAFLLLGLAWMLISIVYFCVRMDRYLSPVESMLSMTKQRNRRLHTSNSSKKIPKTVQGLRTVRI